MYSEKKKKRKKEKKKKEVKNGKKKFLTSMTIVWLGLESSVNL